MVADDLKRPICALANIKGYWFHISFVRLAEQALAPFPCVGDVNFTVVPFSIRSTSPAFAFITSPGLAVSSRWISPDICIFI